jgi:8-oxo-dGTP pyrophosphatase MutT (NUDIX family)
MPDSKQGRLTLLDESHFGQKNPWEQDVVGWQPNSQGFGGLHNPRGFAMLRVVVEKDMDGQMRPLYDQPIIVENPGAIVIAQLGDKIGLIQSYRMVGPRLPEDAGSEYIRRLDEEKLWSELAESLGQPMWEAPRGLIPAEGKTEDECLEDCIIRTAKLEALQEAGLTIGEARIVGQVNANPTFFPHAQYIVQAKIESIGEAQHEDLEIIGAMRLFTVEELRELNSRGEFNDALSLAGLALCGIAL